MTQHRTTTFVLVHGAWHGPWAWDRVVPRLEASGAGTLCPDLSATGDTGLHDHAATVIGAIDQVPRTDRLVLVGHSYAGLVVREAADARTEAVDQVVLVDGWAGADGASLVGLAPAAFGDFVRGTAQASERGLQVPPPPPAAFGIVDPADAAWLGKRLVAQPLRSFLDATSLSGAVDQVPGTAIHCTPATYAFEQLGKEIGYRTRALAGPHDVMITDPGAVAQLLLESLS